VTFDPSSRTKLTARDEARFPEDTLFHRVARVMCRAECLPRKELYEAWEVARRARRRMRGGRVVDLACGHGLVAHLMLLLDDSSKAAMAVDAHLPPSAHAVAKAMAAAWPRIAGRVAIVEGAIESVAIEAGDMVVSVHACGALSDAVIAKAIAARARLALLPCCHDVETCDAGGLAGWMDPALAIDATRAARLRETGYTVHTQVIPAEITAKNRLLLAEPTK
jgi:SAM-dependent methyltransferase